MEEQFQQTAEEPKKRFDWKRSLITIVIVLVTAGAVGGATWFVMDQNAQKEKDGTDKSIQALESTVNDLKARMESKTEETTTPNVSTTTAANKTFTSNYYNLAFNYPTDWTVAEKKVGAVGSIEVKKGNRTINFWVNPSGGDAGLAANISKYTVSVANNKTAVSLPEDATSTRGISSPRFSLTTSSFAFAGNTYYGWVYYDTEAEKAALETVFKNIILSFSTK